MASLYAAIPSAGETIDVEMGEVKVSSCLTDTLMAYGLGACVGVCVYDPILRIAGLAHIVLPEYQAVSPNSNKERPQIAPGKFADSAIPFLIEEICRHGGEEHNLRATIVGGAHIFSPGAATGGAVSRLEIGQRNTAAVVKALERRGVTLLASDVGGCHGRTVQLRVSDGTVTVQPIGGLVTVLANLGRDRDIVSTA